MRALSPQASQSIQKETLGICPQKVHKAYMRDVKTEASKDIDGVMKGHEQSKKAAYLKSTL
jgi:hypothetical protein